VLVAVILVGHLEAHPTLFRRFSMAMRRISGRAAFLRFLSIVGFLSLSLSGVGLGADNVRVGFSALSTPHGVLWIADVAGLLVKNGINAEIIYMPAANQALVAGEMDLGQMTGSYMTYARLQGADPVMIAGVQDILDDQIVARPNIKSMADLKGKRIGVNRFGAASHVRLLSILPRYGLNEREITILQMGDTPERILALVSGAVDATLITPPDHLEALRSGMKVLLSLRELHIHYQGTGLVTTQRLLRKNRDLVLRFLKSYVEAIHVVKTNPAISKKAFAKYQKQRDEKRLDATYQTLRDMAKPKPYPSLEGFAAIIKDASTRVAAAKTANPKDFIDGSLLDELDKTGYIDALYR
jgi:NitT/TauT family transport system substrate-binding protein